MRTNITGTITNRILFYSLPVTLRTYLIIIAIMLFIGIGWGEMTMFAYDNLAISLPLLGFIVFYYFSLPRNISLLYIENRVLHIGRHVVTPEGIQSIDEMPYFVKGFLKIPARVKVYRIRFIEMDSFSNRSNEFSCLLLKKYNVIHLLTLGIFDFFDKGNPFDSFGLGDKFHVKRIEKETEYSEV